MSQTTDVQTLYTEKIKLYHDVFDRLLRYKHGIGAFYRKCDYLQHDMRILDAGCGSGNQTINLHAVSKMKRIKGIEFNGFDLTPAMLAMFKQRIIQEKIKNVKLMRANVLEIEKLPDSWKDYDLIVSSAMLEYLSKKEIRRALSNLKKLLKHDGTMIVFITKQNILMKILIEMWWEATSYKQDEIKKIFNEVGFKNVNFKRFPPPFLHLNLWGHIIEAKLKE